MVHRPAVPSPAIPIERRPRFGPRRLTRASLAAPPARFATRGDHVRQRGEHEARFRESSPLHQKRVKPRLEEVVDVDVAEGRTHQRENALGTKRDAPRKATMRCGWQMRRLGELDCAHTWLFRRRVAEPPVPDGRPEDSQHAEQIERRTPAISNLDRDHQQRRYRAANLARHQQHAGHARALRGRKPAGDDDCGVWKRTGLAGAEAQSGNQELGVVRHHAGERREDRPPQHHARQHASRANPIPQGACRNLEEAIGECEHRRHPPPAQRIDVQRFLDAGSRHGNAHAVDVGDREQQDEEHRDAMAVSHRSPLRRPRG